MSRQTVIFCDFDGTAAEQEVIVSLFRAFGPTGWESVRDAIIAGTVSVRDGVGRLFAQIPSSRVPEMVAYALRIATLRSGFHEFLEYCRVHDYQFLLTSGGVDFFIYPILEGILPRDQIYCNGSDSSGPTVRILWPHACDEQCRADCGMCKPSIMRRFPSERYRRVVVGDGVTDLPAARLADLVIARDLLVIKCREAGIPYEPFETFYDVMAVLDRTGAEAYR
ncbi:MAG: 2-hydroxy-3-keto-5-methylthiopentenyl-1-phosphate phosphatase [Candidatus Methylomirabilis oxygeniifera]|uniref:2,3-diketo-5-methylthio-1-phosphopentane phosphatase n=1 Tax=Methylomirabilis oxygeniifera TaxID=671143 RepID=D5MLU5_METO1|nr:MAG: 2-hydroxy-3-keto-5-methylthiopentenyl-1-phosphate phosphatase [Candidatus Methylomirabilis oxyfera]CBE70002.1 2,3-diketo-5-methylthio-1-phosphopentane phosphatase [Candidatus Methylomirabilis oxyfera]